MSAMGFNADIILLCRHCRISLWTQQQSATLLRYSETTCCKRLKRLSETSRPRSRPSSQMQQVIAAKPGALLWSCFHTSCPWIALHIRYAVYYCMRACMHAVFLPESMLSSRCQLRLIPCTAHVHSSELYMQCLHHIIAVAVTQFCYCD